MRHWYPPPFWSCAFSNCHGQTVPVRCIVNDTYVRMIHREGFIDFYRPFTRNTSGPIPRSPASRRKLISEARARIIATRQVLPPIRYFYRVFESWTISAFPFFNLVFGACPIRSGQFLKRERKNVERRISFTTRKTTRVIVYTNSYDVLSHTVLHVIVAMYLA